MQELNSAEKLREWFRDCPAISAANRFRMDYLGEGPTEYAIYAVPSTLKYRRNILGQEKLADEQTVNFIFASREPYGADTGQNLKNLGFYQEVTGWVVEQNNARRFPEISEGRVTSILPTLTVHPAAVGSNAAKYQIQLKMTYRRKR